MAELDRSPGDLQVTRVVHPFNPPRKMRDVNIKVGPCEKADCSECEEPVASPEIKKRAITYSVVWAKASQKKHKTWENDGALVINGNNLTLQDADGKIVDTAKNFKLPERLEAGTVIKLGGKEIQLQDLQDVVPANADDSSPLEDEVEMVERDEPEDGHVQKKRKFESSNEKLESLNELVYSILWAKASQKKHKTWEHDGLLVINGNDLSLRDADGNILDTAKNFKLPDRLETGTVIKLGGKEIQLQDLQDVDVPANADDSLTQEDEVEMVERDEPEDGHVQKKRKLESPNEVVYSILWAKASQKKHKIWEHDGVLVINGNDLTLQDLDGNIVDTVKNFKLPEGLESGTVLKVGFREVQLQDKCEDTRAEHRLNTGPCILELMGKDEDDDSTLIVEAEESQADNDGTSQKKPEPEIENMDGDESS